MDSRPVAFFDSGIGGLPYLAWVRERLPHERFVYLGDNANFPYGEKNPDELRGIVLEAAGRLISRHDPKLVVVACNTASVVALSDLRAAYPLPFVGVVPAVKPAAESSQGGRIALLATTRTVGEAYSERLIRDFASDCAVVRVAGQPLVSFVEKELLDACPERVQEALEEAVGPLRAERVDSLILGCTHFTYLDRELATALGGAVEIVDSREGVGRQVIKVLRERSAEAPPTNGSSPKAVVLHTGPDDGHYRRYAEHFSFAYGGELG